MGGGDAVAVVEALRGRVVVRMAGGVLGLSFAVEMEGVGVVGVVGRRVDECGGWCNVYSIAWRIRNSNAGYA